MSTRCTWAGRWCLKVGEDRRLRVSFATFDELESEDLTGTPTVVMDDSGSGIVITLAAVDGTGVAAWFDAAAGVVAPADQLANNGRGYTDYAASVQVGTTGGATLKRSATLRLEE